MRGVYAPMNSAVCVREARRSAGDTPQPRGGGVGGTSQCRDEVVGVMQGWGGTPQCVWGMPKC